ncbi:hypothetical protein [Sphingomonas sp.]|jgi:hypothetical protein|uniref:hypothetical protein n=1 Tax=Sphingomonas sp. TaxID=28214 RepID=UPI002E304DA6|nr:hypothetical protein [Sphingomonas sp.]HEX4693371.1 hypothetical protein [Sphingomonas sp.]
MSDTPSRSRSKTMTDQAEPARRAGRMEAALSSARGAANGALDETRRIARRAGEAAEANPMALLAGGIAIGVAAGALLPKSRRETELLAPVGKRLTDAAADAAEAAKDAAKAELSTLPLSKEAARAQMGKVIDHVAKAVSDAGEAALASRSQTSAKPAAEDQTDKSKKPKPRTP